MTVRSEGSADPAGVTLHSELQGAGEPLEQVLAVHESFDALADEHPRAVRVVEQHFFGGRTTDEAGAALGMSDRTVKRDRRLGRAWLPSAIGDSEEAYGPGRAPGPTASSRSSTPRSTSRRRTAPRRGRAFDAGLPRA